MQHPIKISQVQIGADTTDAVSARELHKSIDAKRQFANWIQDRIKKYGFEENRDYIVVRTKKPGNNATLKEYYITLDMAKELAMVENNEKGRQIRLYFIEAEKRMRRQATVPAGCPAERFDNRINGYKGQLAQRKKEIESLRWELMLYKSEVESLKSEKRKNYNLQHTVNNLAGSYTRLREEFTGVAESLEYLAKCIKRRIEAVDYFIGELEKVQPESKSVADAAAERAETSRQWIDTNVKGRVKLR